MTDPRAKAGKGFTLIELLTVIAIVGILAAILIPVVSRVRENARSSQCVSNMRQVGAAMHVYLFEHGVMPPARDANQSGLRAAMAHILWNYVGFESTDSFIGGINEARAVSQLDNVFLCPSSRQRPVKTPNASRIFNEGQGAWYSYAPNISPSINRQGGDFNSGADTGLPYEFLSAPSRTAALVEASFWYTYGTWYHNRDGLLPHNEAGNFLFYDNHVERIVYRDVPLFAGHATSGFFWSGLD